MGTSGGKCGRSIDKASIICAVETVVGGGCCIRSVADVSGAIYRAFAHDHIWAGAEIHADGWSGLKAGLGLWPRLSSQTFDIDDGGR